jgi:hydroxypyruvate isomerase
MRKPLKFDANLSYLFTEFPWEARFDAAARAGFPAVEINAPAPYQFSAREFERRLKEAGLSCVALLAPVGDAPGEAMGIAALPHRRDMFRASMDRALEYCAVSNTKLLHILAGRLADGLDFARAEATYIENMSAAADMARAAGITICIEPICRVRFPGYLVNTTAQAQSLMRRIGRPNVKIIYDFYHAQMEEGHISATLSTSLADIAHIQIGNPPGRHEPGNGELNFDHLFALVEQLGYEGWMGCEYIPSAATVDTLGWARRWNIGFVTR